MAGKRGDRLSALLETHSERLYRLARRLAACPEDALDLVQETFLRAARVPESIPVGLRQEEAWLVRVLVNVRRDQWRKERVRKRYEANPGHPEARPGDSEQTVLVRETVWRALDNLSPRRRAIVVMHELEGRSIADIASLLSITAITVRWHLSRGRRELAQTLRSQLGDQDEQPQRSVGGRGPAPVRNPSP
jgi:RNA polymerase sigma-70 factor (ECF subfamily)